MSDSEPFCPGTIAKRLTGGIKNGELLTAAEAAKFEVLLTNKI
jgi:hypothetical protein